MTRLALLGAALALSFVLAGCGTEFVSDPPRVPAPSAPADPQLDPPAVEVVEPSAITIPKLDAHSTLIPLGLNADDSLEVPPVDQPLQAGYYAGAKPELGDECLPGSTCSSVVVAHVDGYGPDGSKGFPGVFARLDELAPGDEVLVETADGNELRFVVERVEQVAKAKFPSEDFYERDDRPRLNLATCGGAFGNAQPGHYDDNVIVYTVLS